MFYIDTSVIVAYYYPEPLSEKAEAFLMAHLRPAISTLTEVEMFSALSRKIREGELSRKDAAKIVAKFLSHVDAHFYTHLLVEPHHYRLARDWIGLFNTNLKTLDALHLAIAYGEGLTFVTGDQGLAESAKFLALDVVMLKK
jgi:predicted nucleic acid-binding protein